MHRNTLLSVLLLAGAAAPAHAQSIPWTNPLDDTGAGSDSAFDPASVTFDEWIGAEMPWEMPYETTLFDAEPGGLPGGMALAPVPSIKEYEPIWVGNGVACPDIRTPATVKVTDAKSLPIPNLLGWCFAHGEAYVSQGEMGALAYAVGSAQRTYNDDRQLFGFSAWADGAASDWGVRADAGIVVNGKRYFDPGPLPPGTGVIDGGKWQLIYGDGHWTVGSDAFGVEIHYAYDVAAGVGYRISPRRAQVSGRARVFFDAKMTVFTPLVDVDGYLNFLDDELTASASAGYRLDPEGFRICGNYAVDNDLRAALVGRIEAGGVTAYELSPIEPRKWGVADERCTNALKF